MKQVLSQDEINQLLEAINEDEPTKFVGSTKIKIYDFCRPDIISGYSHELKVLHDNTAGLWNQCLYRQFNEKTHIYHKSLDTITLEEFVRGFPNPAVYIIIKGFLDSIPIPQFFIIAIDPKFSIDEQAIKDLSKSLLDEYANIWNKRWNLNLEFKLDSIETMPVFIDVTSRSKMGVFVEMEALINDIEGRIEIFIPKLFLDPLLIHIPRMTGTFESNSNLNNKENFMDNRIKSDIQTGLENVKVQVITELGRTVKTLKEINEVKEGSIMLMDAYSGQNVDVFVNNILFGRGEVVVVDECFGVRFTEIIGQDEGK